MQNNQISENNRSLSEKEEIIIGLRKHLDEQKSEFENYKNQFLNQNSQTELQVKTLNEEKSKLEIRIIEVEKIREAQEHKLLDKMEDYGDLEKNMKTKLENLQNDISKIKRESREETDKLKKELEEAKKKDIELEKSKKLIEQITKEKEILQEGKDTLEDKIDGLMKNNKDILD